MRSMRCLTRLVRGRIKSKKDPVVVLTWQKIAFVHDIVKVRLLASVKHPNVFLSEFAVENTRMFHRCM